MAVVRMQRGECWCSVPPLLPIWAKVLTHKMSLSTVRIGLSNHPYRHKRCVSRWFKVLQSWQWRFTITSINLLFKTSFWDSILSCFPSLASNSWSLLILLPQPPSSATVSDKIPLISLKERFSYFITWDRKVSYSVKFCETWPTHGSFRIVC